MNEEMTVSAWPAAVVIKMRLRSGVEQEFSSWHAKMSTIAVDLPGFISAEVNAPVPPSQPEWRIIQYFRSADQLRAWRESEPHRRLLLEANAFVEAIGTRGLVEEETAAVHADGTVTEVITTYVKPDKIRDYQAWAAKIHQAEAQFPGYRGGFLQPPPSEKQPFWTKLVRFATPEQLDAWLNSSARQGLLREHDALVSSWESHRLPTSFAGWFPSHHTTSASPPAWKQSMLVVLVLFPIVMMELRFLSPRLSGLHVAVSTFIGIVISVVLIAWPFMPLAIRALHWWVLPAQESPRWIHLTGIALLVALYAIEIAACWHLLS
jgi:uncharacterized protein